MTESPKPGFAITVGKGFHITFANGWTASVQFGRGNYCGNRDHPEYGGKDLPPSGTAEIAAWGPDESWLSFEDSGDTVAGYQSPADVLAFLIKVAAFA